MLRAICRKLFGLNPVTTQENVKIKMESHRPVIRTFATPIENLVRRSFQTFADRCRGAIFTVSDLSDLETKLRKEVEISIGSWMSITGRYCYFEVNIHRGLQPPDKILLYVMVNLREGSLHEASDASSEIVQVNAFLTFVEGGIVYTSVLHDATSPTQDGTVDA